MNKHERILARKQEIGSRHRRNLKKYSDNFNSIFWFLFKIYKTGIITFCGSEVNVVYDPNGLDAKEGFRLYEDGAFNMGQTILSRHDKVLRAVIIGKKGFGLWCDQWSDGIADWTFSEEEIFHIFRDVNIDIPTSLEKNFRDIIRKKKMLRYN